MIREERGGAVLHCDHALSTHSRTCPVKLDLGLWAQYEATGLRRLPTGWRSTGEDRHSCPMHPIALEQVT